MVRGRDPCWEHCVLVDATKQKVKCNYCQREFSGGVYRMKFHLAQIRNKDIVPCAEVPDGVRDQIQILLSTPKKQKNSKKLKVDVAINGQQHSSSASGGAHPNNGSVGHQGSTSPSSLPSPTPPEPEIIDVQKQKKETADKKIALFFYHNAIPFSAAKSMYCQEMVDAVAECGVGYKAPSFEKLGNTLLEKAKVDINESIEKLRFEWKATGCTILCNCISNAGTQSLVVFSATCLKGSLFLKSADVSGHENDAHYLFDIIESVVLEVGIGNVVQVITDCEESYVIAGRLLMAKYSSLFWSPCASHCINKMLKDFSNLEWVSTVLKDADIIVRFMYSHEVISNMMRKFTGGKELIRPRITRPVSNFLLLRSIVMEEDNLKYMLSNSEWLLSTFSRNSEAQALNSLLYLERFWNSAQEAVGVSEPLIKVLRMVDGDMPAMGYIYEGMERAKAEIKEYYKSVEGKYGPIWEIIDKRWNMQLHSPLHKAAAFLNPSIFYGRSVKVDSRMRNGFQEALKKIVVEETEKIEVTKELPVYINAPGALGTEFAIMGRTLNAPGDWWMAYGYEIPVLQRTAIWLLSQSCSSHWCRWNPSTFENLHTKTRSISEQDKFKDLVFVHCNLWLKSIDSSRDGRCKPIVFDRIDVNCQWPTESECPPALLEGPWLDS